MKRKFEYRHFMPQIEKPQFLELETYLNQKLGPDGWEVISAVWSGSLLNGGYIIFAKRELA